MDFKEFCTIVKKWKEQGIKLKIKDLNTNETDSVISYEVKENLFQSGTIISFETKPSYARMIEKKGENYVTKIDENTYEVNLDKEHYQIIK